MMTVSVVLPNYNGASLLRRYLPGVLAMAEGYAGETEVIVVDDGSADDSTSVLAALFPDVRVIRHARNLGFQAACNTGGRAARWELVLFLNTDMDVTRGMLTRMVRHFSDHSVFAVAPRSLVTNWGSQPVKHGGPWNESITGGEFRRGWLTLAYPGVRSGEDTSKRFPDPRPILYAPGGALLCSRNRFLALGGFDTLYAPFTVEDLDLCYRAWKRGWTVLYEPDALARHEHSATIGRVGARRRRRIMARNFFLFHWKNLSDRRLLREHLVWLGPRLVFSLARGEQAWVAGFLLALCRLRAALRGRVVECNEARSRDEDVLRSTSAASTRDTTDAPDRATYEARDHANDQRE
jgi:GT2 family glycosyltransferase